jgi:hypothetical protein
MSIYMQKAARPAQDLPMTEAERKARVRHPRRGPERAALQRKVDAIDPSYRN